MLRPRSCGLASVPYPWTWCIQAVPASADPGRRFTTRCCCDAPRVVRRSGPMISGSVTRNAAGLARGRPSRESARAGSLFPGRHVIRPKETERTGRVNARSQARFKGLKLERATGSNLFPSRASSDRGGSPLALRGQADSFGLPVPERAGGSWQSECRLPTLP